MGRAVPTHIQTQLDAGITTLCHVMKVVRSDAVEYNFTDLDRDIAYDGDTYSYLESFNKSNIASSSDFKVDTVDLEGVLSSAGFQAGDLRAGVFDGADVYVTLVDYTAPASGGVKLFRGIIGQVTVRDHEYRVEVRSLMHRLNQNTLRYYTPLCQVDFGSTECGQVRATYTYAVKVSGVDTEREEITITEQTGTITELDTEETLSDGYIYWTSGQNTGTWSEVKDYDISTRSASLLLPAGYPIAVDDEFNLIQGCDKTIATCIATYDNAVNFQGFPDLPGWAADGLPDYAED